MSHEWNDDKSMDYMRSNLENGASPKLASIALSKDVIGWHDEFVLMKPLIPFDYLVNEQGRWVNDGGKTVEELNDPNDVGGDRIGRTLHAESSMMNDPSIQMAATISPDLGYGRSFVYLYSRGENNSIQALAIEFKGTDAQLQRFFIGLGLKGDADISDSTNHDKALLFKNTITPTQILEEATNSLSGDNSQQEYLDRLSRTVSTFPLLMEERNRQIEQFANRAMESMMTEPDIRQGLAMAVYGVMELARQTTDTTVQHIYTDSVETISGIFEYISREPDTSVYQDISRMYHTENLIIPNSVQDLLTGDTSTAFTLLSTEPFYSIDTDTSSTDMVLVWKQIAQESLHISNEQSETLYEEVVQAYETIETATTIIAINAANEYMPISSAIFALGIISGDVQETFTQAEPSGVDYIFQKDSNNIKLSHSEEQSSNIVHALIEKEISTELIELTKEILAQFEKPQTNTGVDYENLILTMDFLHVLQQSPESQWEAIIGNEKLDIQHHIESLVEVIQFLLIQISGDSLESFEPAVVLSENTHHQVKSETILERESIQQFSFGVTLLLLYKYMNFVSSLEKIQMVVQKNISEHTTHKESHISLIQSLKESSKDIIEKEPAPWLLFAIIWHLAMIREQGFAQSNAQSAGKKQKKNKSNTNLPIQIPSNWTNQLHVIYAYSS